MIETAIKQWDKCLEIIKDNLSTEQYKAWFEPIVAVGYDGTSLTLKVPSPYYIERIEEQYVHLLKSVISHVFGPATKLFYKANVAQNAEVKVADAGESAILKSGVHAQSAANANPFVKHEEYDDIDPQLNLRYTFENYCSSACNLLPLTVAKAIADNPECKTYNPLFVFGSTGVGKTHLIQAIGIRIKERNPRTRVLYVTAKVFENQYVSASRNNKAPDFINFYQSIDVLIIDDIQDFAGKSRTQNTFFHIFNHLHQNGKQLIMSCDCRPSDLDGLEPRLISRFKWGMTVELSKPDYELRREVLSLKAAQDGLTLSDEVLDLIATSITDSIRDLEGVVVSLLAHATVMNSEITTDLARSVIGNAVKLRPKPVCTFEFMVETIADFYNIDVDDIYGKSRKREISDARQVLMYFAKTLGNMSSTNVGMRLSRNHATVLHACKQVEQRVSIEKQFRQEIEQIRSKLS
ncbi:MAG: chromosomal replication initiator protein DnaA [Muribaculaceae bacterium]|nr:chromosomal replication initiator protein DnaA [Muribaculaceae bacterium]